jgi:PAS domain-containing protein
MQVNGEVRQAGTARKGSDAAFRRMIEKLPAAAYVCDAEGLITYFNPRAAELWGREPKLNDPQDRY